MMLTELNFYEPTTEGKLGDFERHLGTSNFREDNINEDDCNEYEVVFDINQHRYYCYIKARSLEEALGIFYMNHPNITYDSILEHGEM